MNLLDTVPEKDDDIEEFLSEFSKYLNNRRNRAEGNLYFFIHPPDEYEYRWIIEVDVQISDGQDNDSREIRRDPKLSGEYSGATLKAAAERLFSSYKSKYR